MNVVAVEPEPGDAPPSPRVVTWGVPPQSAAWTDGGPVPAVDWTARMQSANTVAARVRGEGCLFMAG